MDTPEKRALIDEATTRFQTLLDERGRQTAVTVSSFRSPYYLPSQGLCAHVSLYDNSTYQGPSGDFVVVPSAALMDPSALWPALEAKLVALEARGVDALADPLAATLGLAELAPSEDLFADPLQEARRRASLDTMLSRFDAVAAQFRAHYGLRMPRWMAVLAAFVDSASELERNGLESIGRRPGGALGYFEDGGLERATIDGLDPRLEMRFRCDPPEMVSFLWGDSDGLHYGMFYDDPAELPGAIVYNWARDSAETWAAEQTTGLSLLAARVRERFTDRYREEEPGVAEWALRAALRWFAEADRRAVDEDGIVRYRGVKREAMLGAVSAALPKSAGDPRLSREKVEARQVEYRKKRTPKIVREWIAEARDELAKARPAFAYTLGRELHWLDSDLYRAVSEELLVAAYEALGRRALADILRVHVANRDLPMVTVFQRS